MTSTTVDGRPALWRAAWLIHKSEAAAPYGKAHVSSSAEGSTPGGAVVSGSGSVNGYPCGGPLPSCCTLEKESRGTPTAQNPTSSSSGLWQFTDSTWGGYGGYPHAKDAPPAVQNARAVEVFAGGAGASNWYGDGCYNGR